MNKPFEDSTIYSKKLIPGEIYNLKKMIGKEKEAVVSQETKNVSQKLERGTRICLFVDMGKNRIGVCLVKYPEKNCINCQVGSRYYHDIPKDAVSVRFVLFDDKQRVNGHQKKKKLKSVLKDRILIGDKGVLELIK